MGATAMCLPTGWIVQIEWNGQLAMTPGDGAPYFTAAWAADPGLRVVRRRPFRRQPRVRTTGMRSAARVE